jgi:hypothetical protein
MKEPASSLAILCVLFDDSLRFFVPFVITKGIDQFFEQNSEHVLSKKNDLVLAKLFIIRKN